METGVEAVSMLNNQPLSSAVFTPQAVPLPLNIAADFLYKNKLQQYTQKSSLPYPVYQTVKEGPSHAPIFRSTVCVNGVQYISSVCFNRKAAEQDAARVALSSVSPPPKDVKDDECPDVHRFINEDTTFCKSILNEYTTKKRVEMPVYTTIESWEKIPVFSSSLVLNGISYNGHPGRSKKEAEQLASRAAVLSILDSENGKDIYEIIRSKLKLYAAINGLKGTLSDSNAANVGNQVVFDIHKRKSTDDSINFLSSEIQAVSSSVHELKKPRADADMAALPLIAFVPEGSETTPPSVSGVNQNGKKKKRRNKKKKAKEGLQGNIHQMSAAVVVSPLVTQ